MPDNELPDGATLTGTWSFGHVAVPEQSVSPFEPDYIPISFPVKLSAELPGTNVHILAEADTPTTECPGSATDPEAVAGHLCLYTGDESPRYNGTKGWLPTNIIKPNNEKGGGSIGAATSGALLEVAVIGNEAGDPGAFAFGTWAVTAP